MSCAWIQRTAAFVALVLCWSRTCLDTTGPSVGAANGAWSGRAGLAAGGEVEPLHRGLRFCAGNDKSGESVSIQHISSASFSVQTYFPAPGAADQRRYAVSGSRSLAAHSACPLQAPRVSLCKAGSHQEFHSQGVAAPASPTFVSLHSSGLSTQRRSGVNGHSSSSGRSRGSGPATPTSRRCCVIRLA